jgi:nucleoside-diphosphate-sugar epimerase
MKVFVAGATGAIGRQLLPLLVEAGHDVYGMTHSAARQQLIRELGAEPVLADALDADQVAEAVGRVQPDVIVHQLTSIGPMDLRHFDQAFAMTNRLRTEGTDHLLSAGQAVGVKRFVAQSFFAAYERVGGPVKNEDDTFGVDAAKEMRATVAAIRHVEDSVLAATWTEGIVLRYGGFYGPHTSLGADGEQTEAVRQRKFPVVGNGGGVWSFIHIADAAEATVAAIDHGKRGVYNIVDDEPAPVSEWLPALARTLGAKQPMHVPRFVGRLLTGEIGAVMMTELRGASNAKAKRELGWQPSHATWRDGFRGLTIRDTGRQETNAV